ncbi:MAG: hypothetical protein ACUVSY_12430 [Roseiflexus sp.]
MTAPEKISATDSQTTGFLLDSPFTIAAQIVESIGPRPPGSIGEAKMAAFLDARLRRSGLRISVESYHASHSPEYDGIAYGTLAITGVIVFYWMPLAAIIVFVACCGGTFLTLWYGTAFLTRRMLSQNVIATRAAEGVMRWRLVLLAPLCSPPAVGRWVLMLGSGSIGRIGRTIAATLLLALGIAATAPLPLEIRLWLWYTQAVPAAALLAQGIAALVVQHAPATPGAISYAGALATLICAASHMRDLQHTELWMVGVGAASSTAGIDDLLHRYPFEPQQTLFIGLDGIGTGELCYLAAEGALRPQSADSLLLHLVERVVDSGQAAARPRAYRGITLAGMVRRRGLRTLGIASLNRYGHIPYRNERSDDISRLDAAHLDNTVRLIVELAHSIDTTL